MDDEEYQYFTPDRLTAVIKSYVNYEGIGYDVHELIHLTSRFGAFRREGKRWESIWPGWNPDPDFLYVNFKSSSYEKVLRLFDEHPPECLDFFDVKEHQEILDWEGDFDLTVGPHHFRDIQELVNQIQDFVEPRPRIITYGNGNVSCGDMAWMHPYLSDLNDQREIYEQHVLEQKQKPHKVLMEEPLLRIEMYPPLHDDVISHFTAAANQVPDLEAFDEEYQNTIFMNYFHGGRATMNQLLGYYREFLSITVANRSILTKAEADRFQLTRELYLRPANRLEAWFVGEDRFHQLVANTEFGLFESLAPGKWRPVIRDWEIEDLYDMAGVSRIHIRPEREEEVLRHHFVGGFSEKTINDPELNKYRVEYRNEETDERDFYDRTPLGNTNKFLRSALKRVGATVVREMVNELRADLKVLTDEGIQVDSILDKLVILENFLRNKIELSYQELRDLLYACFRSDPEEGNGIQQLAEDVRKKNASRLKFEKLMDHRDVEFLPLTSMVLIVAYQPSTTMWLEYRSHYYGRLARRKGKWQTNIQQDPEIYKELHLYEVKEECASELVEKFDAIAMGTRSAPFGEIAPMLFLLRMNKDADLQAISNDDWDSRPFSRSEMQPSTALVFESIYSQIQQYFEEKADTYGELSQDQLAQALLEDREELSAIYGDEVRKFIRKGGTLDREHLSIFMTGALEILTRNSLAQTMIHGTAKMNNWNKT
jgi:hypothetical protein